LSLEGLLFVLTCNCNVDYDRKCFIALVPDKTKTILDVLNQKLTAAIVITIRWPCYKTFYGRNFEIFCNKLVLLNKLGMPTKTLQLIFCSYNNDTRSQWFKTFYGRNLRMLV